MNDLWSTKAQSKSPKEGPRILVIGVGNAYRGDDSAGIAVARELSSRVPRDVVVAIATGEGAGLVEAWKNFETVILVDASSSGTAPGTVTRFEANRESIPAETLHTSTHAFSVAQAIELARALNRLPSRLIVYAIEGETFETGAPMSDRASASVQVVARRIMREVQLLSRKAL